MDLGLGIGVRSDRGGYTLVNAEAETLVASMSTPPSAARKALIDALISSLKASGVWAKLDLLYVLAAHDAQAARLNWIGASFNLTATNSPTFTTDRGYAGDGTTSYLATGWTPLSSAVHFATSSMSLGCWINAGTDTASGTAVALGCASSGTGANLLPRGSSNRIQGRPNSATTINSGVNTALTRMGFTAVARQDAVNASFYRNAALDSTVAAASVSLPNSQLLLCGMSSTGSFVNGVDNRIAAAFAGEGLGGTEMTSLHSALAAYLSAVGAN